MARTLKADGASTKKGKKNGKGKAPTAEQMEASPTLGHNSDARGQVIREAVHEIIALKAERALVSEQITAVRGRVKSLGLKAIDFNVALRLAELEVEDRNASLDGLRECFSALGLGDTVDWVDTQQRPKREPPADEKIDTKTARAAGREAGKAGKASTSNPHAKGGPQFQAWAEGWMQGTEENLPEQGGEQARHAPN